tara:strand:- start:222 stop:782 length:561 start_codon:yes stop_codon:yes gene_type:complete
MNEALKNILNRNSPRELSKPHPSKKEMEIIYQAALRAPDHAWLRPSRFIQVTGKGLEKLSSIFIDYAKENIENLTEENLQRYKDAPYRAPMIVILISEIKSHPKVPETEQMLSTAAAAQNILLALNALDYAGMWRTGVFALNEKISKYLELDDNQKVIGYLYVGTATGKQKKIPEMDTSEYVTEWI